MEWQLHWMNTKTGAVQCIKQVTLYTTEQMVEAIRQVKKECSPPPNCILLACNSDSKHFVHSFRKGGSSG